MLLNENFKKRIIELLPDSHNAFFLSLEQTPYTSIRINPLKKYTLDFATQVNRIPWVNEALILRQRPNFTYDPLFHAGSYYVQEASSMILEFVYKQIFNDTSKPLLCLDLCAAPGGKSTHLTNLIGENSLLVSNEIISNRANVLEENLTKWGTNNYIVTNDNIDSFTKLGQVFDLILIDAPCSGEGMCRKDESILPNWSEDNIISCSIRQKDLVEKAVKCLKNNGVIMYSTCTWAREENEDIIKYLLYDSSLEKIEISFPDDFGVTTTNYGYRFYPHKTIGEGFFISVIRKVGNDNIAAKIDNKNSKIPLELIKNDTFSSYFKKKSSFFKLNNRVFAISSLSKNFIDLASGKVRIKNFTTEIGEIKGKDFVPSHSLAMSNYFNQDSYQSIELNEIQSISYLKKEIFEMPEKRENGYCLVKYKGQSLGFIKVIGSRTNNLYPVNWRIRR